MNVGLPDLLRKSCLRKTLYFKKKKRKTKINFFGKVSETNIHSESFLKFDSAHFGMQIELC